jgi:HK97 family phage major capsid protein
MDASSEILSIAKSNSELIKNALHEMDIHKKTVEDKLHVMRQTQGLAEQAKFDRTTTKGAGQRVIEALGGVEALARTPMLSVEVPGLLTKAALVTPTDINSISDQSRAVAPEGLVRLRDVLDVLPVSTTSVGYHRLVSWTPAAALVADTGALKPETTINLDPVLEQLVTLATTLEISKAALADAQQFARLIEALLLRDVALTEESYAVGVLNTAASAPTLSGTNAPDRISEALTALEVAGFAPSFVALHPQDWRSIERLKSTAGEYLLGGPGVAAATKLWSVPVLRSLGITVGNFLVGAREGAALFVRESANVEVGTINDQFKKNLLTLRCEERVLAGVYTPLAFRKGTLAGA